MTKDISIWDKEGKEADRISLNYSISFPNKGRTSRIDGTDLFLKGTGLEYRGQNLYGDFNKEDFDNLIYSDEVPGISAYGFRKSFKGKTGIFLDRYQPYFRDCIGGCGPKERKILTNQNMPLSGLEVIEEISVNIPGHSIYKCRYKDNRSDIYPKANKLLNLMELISEGIWYCPWDKNLYDDLDSFGNIRDVADWGKMDSPSFTKAMGTMYSLIYSLFKTNKNELDIILREFGANIEVSLVSIPTLCAGLIGLFNQELVPDSVNLNIDITTYRKLYLEYILECDPCACLDLKEEFGWIKKEYRNKFMKSQGM